MGGITPSTPSSPSKCRLPARWSYWGGICRQDARNAQEGQSRPPMPHSFFKQRGREGLAPSADCGRAVDRLFLSHKCDRQ